MDEMYNLHFEGMTVNQQIVCISHFFKNTAHNIHGFITILTAVDLSLIYLQYLPYFLPLLYIH